jgi:nucleotide-binding universal stress UspA family protein
LRWAAEEARQRNGSLRVVLAWEPAYLATYSSATVHADCGEQERAARALLDETLRLVFREDTPDHMEAEVIQGVAERVLVGESGAADLLVLGSAVAAEHVSPPVGPVIRGCLRQACCPVMIIGPRRAAPLQPTLAVH